MFNPFKKKQAEEPETESDDENLADDEAAVGTIQMKCQVGTLFAGRMYDSEEDFADQSTRYKRIRNECIEIVDRIGDEFYRGFAIHSIINMCMVAKDVVVARALLVAVRDEFIREKIFETAPALRSDQT